MWTNYSMVESFMIYDVIKFKNCLKQKTYFWNYQQIIFQKYTLKLVYLEYMFTIIVCETNNEYFIYFQVINGSVSTQLFPPSNIHNIINQKVILIFIDKQTGVLHTVL